jgi:hypothetical protein
MLTTYFSIPRNEFIPGKGFTGDPQAQSGSFYWSSDRGAHSDYPPEGNPAVCMEGSHDIIISRITDGQRLYDADTARLAYVAVAENTFVKVRLFGTSFRMYLSNNSVIIQGFQFGADRETTDNFSKILKVLSDGSLMQIFLLQLVSSRGSLFTEGDVKLLGEIVDGNNAQKRGSEVRELASRIRVAISI